MTLDRVFREDWGRVLATLIGLLGDFELAEEAAADAFSIAAERWPRDGTPSNPRAWLIRTARNRATDRIRRDRVLAGSGTLAQFGGVMLAFAFLATFGFNGLVTLFLHDQLGVDTFAWGGWIYELPGLVLVYTYFQIPLMVIVFLPAVDGLRPQWREACESLGGSAWSYWRYVGFPILWPSFLGATLLLFANAFGAIATAYALPGSSLNIVTILLYAQIRGDVLHDPHLGYALAFGMIVVTGIANGVYIWLRARAERWMK
jgi:putative spermidine/putrescine transport system permease protein